MQVSKIARQTTVLLVGVSLAASCSLFKKKADKSNVTGWNYNDKNYGNITKANPKDIKTAPGLVFVQGGTFTMGA
ncbi:MAG: gliding motility lipoprotein GldJ, partial [Sphingobacteriia bacterium]